MSEIYRLWHLPIFPRLPQSFLVMERNTPMQIHPHLGRMSPDLSEFSFIYLDYRLDSPNFRPFPKHPGNRVFPSLVIISDLFLFGTPHRNNSTSFSCLMSFLHKKLSYFTFIPFSKIYDWFSLPVYPGYKSFRLGFYLISMLLEEPLETEP
jgi:hypothetical protein